jgi:hypothetical protein
MIDEIIKFNIYFIIITERLRLGKYDTFHTYLILMIDEITLFNIYFIIIVERFRLARYGTFHTYLN